MLTEIKNAQISFVSLVDKAANQRQFAIIKRAGEAPPFEKSAPILKVDEEKRIVTGVVYEPDTPDTHDEFMTAQEIEKAAHQFLKDYRNIDKQHDFTSGQGEVVESWIAKSDTTVGEQQIREGTWLMSVHVPDDEIWSEIKKGNITGFNMGGVGERVKQVTKSESEQATGLYMQNNFGALTPMKNLKPIFTRELKYKRTGEGALAAAKDATYHILFAYADAVVRELEAVAWMTGDKL